MIIIMIFFLKCHCTFNVVLLKFNYWETPLTIYGIKMKKATCMTEMNILGLNCAQLLWNI